MTRLRLLAALVVAAGVAPDLCLAIPAADRQAALLVYPLVQVDGAGTLDTIIEISNETDAPVSVHCFYAGGAGQCLNGSPCSSASDCVNGTACVAPTSNVPFQLTLTAHQPLSWRASAGREEFPCSNPAESAPFAQICGQRSFVSLGCGLAPALGIAENQCIGGTNAGSSVPALGPYVGALECVVVDAAKGKPRDDNALRGSALIEKTKADSDYLDVARYAAFGVRTLADQLNDNSVLHLGGDTAELESCPTRQLFEHPGELYVDAPGEDTQTRLELAVVPCTWDFAHGAAPRTTAILAAYNEFEQHFSTSFSVSSPRVTRVASLDSAARPFMSIFSSTLLGTAGVHTELTSSTTGSGLLAVMFQVQESVATPGRPRTEAVQTMTSGSRPARDVIFLDVPECPGDCLGDGKFDTTDTADLTRRFNIGCPCPSGAPGIDDNGCSLQLGLFFPNNQCYAADLDGSRCIAASELTKIIGDASKHGPSGCP